MALFHPRSLPLHVAFFPSDADGDADDGCEDLIVVRVDRACLQQLGWLHDTFARLVRDPFRGITGLTADMTLPVRCLPTGDLERSPAWGDFLGNLRAQSVPDLPDMLLPEELAGPLFTHEEEHLWTLTARFSGERTTSLRWSSTGDDAPDDARPFLSPALRYPEVVHLFLPNEDRHA